MIDEPTCPVCDSSNWRKLGSRTFELKGAQDQRGWRKVALEVLFQVWAPGASSFTVTYRLCETCGLVIYAPRPAKADVTAKYQYSKSVGHSTTIPWDAPREARRARRIFKLLAPHMTQNLRGARVLDYGGGDGRLLRNFVEVGAKCHVLDYVDATIPGVTHIGTTEQDLAALEKYDAIVCNHVVEHLVDPLDSLRRLSGALKPGGAVYVEVPVEIWRRPPAQSEPVTHINFFVPGSLSYLMQKAGFDVQYARYSGYPHPAGYSQMAVSCIAKGTDGAAQAATANGVAEVERLLRPSMMARIRRRALLAEDIPGAVMRKVRRAATGRGA